MPTTSGNGSNSNAIADNFDELYRSTARYWWRQPQRHSTDPNDHPTSLLTQQTLRLINGKPAGRALDLGAGEGADSIRLARLGYTVTAVEISSVAAAKVSAFAAEAGVGVDVRVADISDFKPTGQFGVIICKGVLHYIHHKRAIIEKMQRATLPGGINVISLWSTHTPVPDCHSKVPVFCDDEDGIVRELYRGWTIELIYFERYKQEKSHAGMPHHLHSHIKLITRRPD